MHFPYKFNVYMSLIMVVFASPVPDESNVPYVFIPSTADGTKHSV
jgi:hypothetical protein